MSTPKYDIEVQVSGLDGNSMVLIAAVTKAMRRARVPSAEIKEFFDEAISGDYDNVLQTCMKWVDVS